MGKIQFTADGWRDYIFWQTADRKTANKINALIKDTERDGNSGIGKPEALIGDLSGYYSRRIDEKNRFVYRLLDNGDFEIQSCRGHYNDK
ncbi:MAG: Txe/YoeB family addiction module toxin [Planctomycetota bacterium]|nr:Txe/YoeB family addiction module toxin [Planctomycetota bacterium]